MLSLIDTCILRTVSIPQQDGSIRLLLQVFAPQEYLDQRPSNIRRFNHLIGEIRRLMSWPGLKQVQLLSLPT
jgi:hypothetical protein